MKTEFQPIPALNGTISDFKSMILEEKDAFTLAETLITLMVIGVVAALTIPSLMQTWRDRQFATAKKKAMTITANGYKQMVADNDGNYSTLPLFQCGTDFSCLSEIHRKFFKIDMDKANSHDGLAAKYTKSGDSSEEAGFSWDDVPYIFTTQDGMTYGFLASEEGNSIEIVVDTNGEKSPNKICKDVYKMIVKSNGGVTESKIVNGEEKGLCEDLNEPLSVSAEFNIDELNPSDLYNLTNDQLDQIYAQMDKPMGDDSYGCYKKSDGRCLQMVPCGESCSGTLKYDIENDAPYICQYCN